MVPRVLLDLMDHLVPRALLGLPDHLALAIGLFVLTKEEKVVAKTECVRYRDRRKN